MIDDLPNADEKALSFYQFSRVYDGIGDMDELDEVVGNRIEAVERRLEKKIEGIEEKISSVQDDVSRVIEILRDSQKNE